jgi:hypothetical protein
MTTPMTTSAALLAALDRQHRQLTTAVARLEEDAQRLVPAINDARWQGPARLAYEVALWQLKRSLDGSTAQLRSARDHTAVALRTLAGRVG